MKRIIPEIITIGIVIIGALCYPLIVRGLQYAPPFLFSALRVLIAGISILFVLPFLHQPVIPPKSVWKWVILFSIPAVVFTYGTMFLSHGRTGGTLVPVLENLQPFLTVIFAIIFLHEKPSPATRAVLIFGTLGIFFISVQALTGGLAYNFQSAMLAFFVSFSAAATGILAKYIKRPDVIVTISAWQFITGSIPLFILWQLFEKNMAVQFNPPFLSILLFLAIIGSGATSAVWYALIQKVEVSRLSVLFFLLPGFGLVLANRFSAVPVTVLQWIGIITIIGGVIIGIKKQAALPARSA